MKSLQEWLASSSSSSSSSEAKGENPATNASSSPAANPSSPIDELRKRQESLRERMQSLLGAGAVEASSTATNTASAGPMAPTTLSPDSLKAPIASQSPDSPKAPIASQSPPPADCRRVEVMVVDRGTQTTTTVGCQTDPMPPAAGAWAPCCMCAGAGAGVQRTYTRAFAANSSQTTAQFREQLELIQNSVDMLIARYNLPPPPLHPTI